MDIFDDLIRTIKKEKPPKERWVKLKTKICKKYKAKKIPTDTQILLRAKKKDLNFLKKYLQLKPTRTISGVAVCAIMTKPLPCPHGKCLMCPGGVGSVFGSVPQSYTGKEPATRRAIRNKFDPYLQVFNRLEQYVVSGHNFDKIELIIMGGTFPSFPKKYQEDFIKYALKAMNDFSSLFFKKNEFDIEKFKRFFELPGNINDKKRIKSVHDKILKLKNRTTLEKEQKRNEDSQVRCVSLVIETRPDYATLKHANQMLKLGCTKVELGIQTIYDYVLNRIKRGHTVKDSIEATRILKDLGFKINYHMMLGLPGVNRKQDLFALQTLFRCEKFRPDMLKLYPCMVLRGTKLYNLWKRKKYAPLTTKQAIDLISEFKKTVPSWVRIARVQRDIPTFMTEAGVDRTNLRQYIEEKMKKQGIKCRCIRCRESGRAKKIEKIDFLILEYKASKGKEFFISAEDVKNDVLIGFCRLRFQSQQLRKEITKDSALIRELHVFSPAVAIGEKSRTSMQHKGIGKKLVEMAENIAKTYQKKKVVVISGIGARNYFRSLSYRKEGPYMVKNL